MINNIIRSKVDSLSKEYYSLKDELNNGSITTKGVNRLAEVSYQLKILNEIMVEANI